MPRKGEMQHGNRLQMKLDITLERVELGQQPCSTTLQLAPVPPPPQVTVVVAGGAAAPEDLAAVCLPVNLCLGKAVPPTALAAQFPTLALIE